MSPVGSWGGVQAGAGVCAVLGWGTASGCFGESQAMERSRVGALPEKGQVSSIAGWFVPLAPWWVAAREQRGLAAGRRDQRPSGLMTLIPQDPGDSTK